MKQEIFEDHSTGDTFVNTRINFRDFLSQNCTQIVVAAIDKISDHIAAVFVEKHGAEIMAKLNPDAIANMTIAAAGAKVNETLNKKMPDVIHHHVTEVTKREVFQRGLFGGLKRL